MAEKKNKSPNRSPKQIAQDNADKATQKYTKKAEQYGKARAEANRLEEEVRQLKADADFLNSHPLLNEE